MVYQPYYLVLVYLSGFTPYHLPPCSMTLGLIFEKAKLSIPRPLQLPFLLHWCNQACLPNLPRPMLIQVSVQISSHWKGLPDPSVWSSILPQTLSSHLFSSYSSLYVVLFLHVSFLPPPIRKKLQEGKSFLSLLFISAQTRASRIEPEQNVDSINTHWMNE